MNKKVLLISCSVLFLMGLIFLISSNRTKIEHVTKNETISSILEQVHNQEKINAKLNVISKSDKYTIKNPYIELNPYELSPLSAIIIFKTSKEETIKVKINSKVVTTMEASKTHIIPIYGLLENTTNNITLSTDKESYDYKIKTNKINNLYPIKIEKKVSDNNDILFTVSKNLKAFDMNSNLCFYLTVDNRMDVEWLDNGHFLIGTTQGQYANNFVAFAEMDYLGKIYNYYVPENGYSSEFQVLKNGNYMIAGGNKPVYIDEQVIYEVDKNNGKKISEINLSKIIKEIDPNFNKEYLGQKAILNAFAYNEYTKELLISFRGMDAIISYNYNRGKLNYVFTDPNNELFKNDVWKNYLVTLTSGRYPLGAHSVILTKNGNIAILNNGYNYLHGYSNGGKDKVTDYKDNYSSAEIYSIRNKHASLIKSYDYDLAYFSYKYGSIKEYDNNYIINFGFNLKDDYRNNVSGKLSETENNLEYIYSKIIETDINGNTIMEAKSEEGYYRVFKNSFYNEKTPNSTINTLNIFNRIKKEKYITYKINDDIKDSDDWIYSAYYTENTLNTNYNILDNDKIDILFVRGSDVFEFNYKEKNNKNKNRIFNFKLKSGKYHMYIKVNDKIYNTHKIVEY